MKFNYWLTGCKSAELASRKKSVRRELMGRDGGKISDHGNLYVLKYACMYACGHNL